ncbi:hypothetical protein [Streptomyces sp. NBC_00059]|uniref:hypothetical protein n=1 Tax=Streptomyces sp. NBC_00059 TaxID=2975635 RepID=UPI0022578AFE|nr:hypothetical protein [Streptomyces sp. NBC_00059]MCX5417601.1 hypothetical protein [Streptomyces sp. NBC_00059]
MVVVLRGRRQLHCSYEHKAEHLLAFGGIASTVAALLSKCACPLFFFAHVLSVLGVGCRMFSIDGQV